MASPHAAGVAALTLSVHPGLQPASRAAFLERTAEPLPCPEGIYNPRPGLDQFLAECNRRDAQRVLRCRRGERLQGREVTT